MSATVLPLIQLCGRYVATVRMRRGPTWPVKSGLEGLDGLRLTVEAKWRIGPGDHSLYLGEWAMYSPELEPFGLVWLASGDLVLEAVSRQQYTRCACGTLLLWPGLERAPSALQNAELELLTVGILRCPSCKPSTSGPR